MLGTESKETIALPVTAFALNAFLIFSADSYVGSYKAASGFTRTTSISIGILGWLEPVLLLAVIITEFYKQYKCDE